jgi:hypothetical protein
MTIKEIWLVALRHMRVNVTHVMASSNGAIGALLGHNPTHKHVTRATLFKPQTVLVAGRSVETTCSNHAKFTSTGCVNHAAAARRLGLRLSNDKKDTKSGMVQLASVSMAGWCAWFASLLRLDGAATDEATKRLYEAVRLFPGRDCEALRCFPLDHTSLWCEAQHPHSIAQLERCARVVRVCFLLFVVVALGSTSNAHFHAQTCVITHTNTHPRSLQVRIRATAEAPSVVVNPFDNRFDSTATEETNRLAEEAIRMQCVKGGECCCVLCCYCVRV